MPYVVPDYWVDGYSTAGGNTYADPGYWVTGYAVPEPYTSGGNTYAVPGYWVPGYAVPEPYELRARRGGGAIERAPYRDWLRKLKEDVAALDGDAPQEAAEAALVTLRPIAAAADGQDYIAAVRAISEALRAAAERQRGHRELMRAVEAQIARIEAIRKRRRDEVALLTLGILT